MVACIRSTSLWLLILAAGIAPAWSASAVLDPAALNAEVARLERRVSLGEEAAVLRDLSVKFEDLTGSRENAANLMRGLVAGAAISLKRRDGAVVTIRPTQTPLSYGRSYRALVDASETLDRQRVTRPVAPAALEQALAAALSARQDGGVEQASGLARSNLQPARTDRGETEVVAVAGPTAPGSSSANPTAPSGGNPSPGANPTAPPGGNPPSVMPNIINPNTEKSGSDSPPKGPPSGPDQSGPVAPVVACQPPRCPGGLVNPTGNPGTPEGEVANASRGDAFTNAGQKNPGVTPEAPANPAPTPDVGPGPTTPAGPGSNPVVKGPHASPLVNAPNVPGTAPRDMVSSEKVQLAPGPSGMAAVVVPRAPAVSAADIGATRNSAVNAATTGQQAASAAAQARAASGAAAEVARQASATASAASTLQQVQSATAAVRSTQQAVAATNTARETQQAIAATTAAREAQQAIAATKVVRDTQQVISATTTASEVRQATVIARDVQVLRDTAINARQVRAVK